MNLTNVNVNALNTLADIFARSRVIDLTALLEPGIPRWPSHPHIVIDPTVNHAHDGYYCQSISLAEHTGTHVDAPYHIHPDLPERTIEHVPADAIMGSCTVIDLSARDWKPGETAQLDDVLDALKQSNTEIEEGDIVLINFGWFRRYWTTSGEWKFYATNQPGLSEDIAEYFMSRKVKAVGTDVAAVGTSVKDGQSEPCAFHEKVLRQNVYLIECLANMEQLPAKCFFIASPLKIKNGSGSPIRAVAVIPQH